jgi:superfamily I DNA and/or RNA helicase
MEQVGIIVPFRSVVYDLRNRLYDAGIRTVEVGTIHTFQGREKDYIIFDTVMSGEKQHGRERHYSVRPLDETKNGLSVPRLLNVAFSRSRKELVVIADMNHINKVYGKKFLGKLLRRMV